MFIIKNFRIKKEIFQTFQIEVYLSSLLITSGNQCLGGCFFSVLQTLKPVQISIIWI